MSYDVSGYDEGLKFTHAGTPEPAPLMVASTCDAVPQGWGGMGGSFHTPDNIEAVGAEYGNYTSAAVDYAMSKRDAEHAFLNQ